MNAKNVKKRECGAIFDKSIPSFIVDLIVNKHNEKLSSQYGENAKLRKEENGKVVLYATDNAWNKVKCNLATSSPRAKEVIHKADNVLMDFGRMFEVQSEAAYA